MFAAQDSGATDIFHCRDDGVRELPATTLFAPLR
jgi:hypothetical protein